jgi:hypothetical protein
MLNNLATQSSNIDLAHSGYLGIRFPKKLQQLLAEKKVSDEQLHGYCLFALRSCIEYGNTSFALSLLVMLGKRYPFCGFLPLPRMYSSYFPSKKATTSFQPVTYPFFEW